MKSIQVASGGVKLPRQVEVKTGEEYIIQPHNPRKLKNRGRHCLVLDFVPVNDTDPDGYIVAKVRYLDNNRIGKVELADLLPA